jgi:alanine racemase
MMNFFRILRRIKRSFATYNPVVEVLIYKDNLIHNLNEYKRKYPELAFAPVLKSNAYGHGLSQVANILDKEKIAFLVVDSLFEAMALRNEGMKSHILIVGYVSAENISNSKTSNAAFAITSLEQLKKINQSLGKEKKFHLKIDTGMHRQGILPNEIEEAIEIIQNNEFINLEGICSHLADADNNEENFTLMQIEKWQKAVDIIRQNFKTVRFFHLSASAGVKYADKIEGNVARLGLGLYGINPSPFVKLNLKPVLEMQSVVSSVKTIDAGECVGYNATYKADKTMRVATVPVGYFEGIDRRLSNLGFFKIENNFCPIIGRVSMNISSIDITSAPEAKLDSRVVVISHNSQDNNSVENIAKLAHTIPYEILVHIPQHLRRVVK